MLQFEFKAEIWQWPGHAAWHFVTLPKSDSADIKAIIGINGRGFGSIRVEVTIGKTSWRTSIFPDSKAGAYLLPLKASVRKAESLQAGDTAHINLALLT